MSTARVVPGSPVFVRVVRTGRAHRIAPMTRLITGVSATISQWIARFRQRRALREIVELNDRHLLRDIGVTRDAALREAEKPFWRL
jgi:uncharacterized protein YjiS (DUF1127 family)